MGFFVIKVRGKLFVVRRHGKRGRLEFWYILKSGVQIPARPYLRPGIVAAAGLLPRAIFDLLQLEILSADKEPDSGPRAR